MEQANGTDRRAVGGIGTAHSPSAPTGRRQRTTAAGEPRGVRRRLVGAEDRGAVGGPARAVPAVSDLSPALSGMGERGGDQGRVMSVSPRPRGSGRARPLGVFHRRHVCGGEKGGSAVGKTKRGKGSKVMAISDAFGTCLALHVTSASPHEVRLVHETLATRHVSGKPDRLIGDKAYDSDPLDAELAEQGVELIAPHRRNRKKPKTQDGRKLRRYKRRWKNERLFAHLGDFRRLVVRYERLADNFLGFLQLGCIKLLLKRF